MKIKKENLNKKLLLQLQIIKSRVYDQKKTENSISSLPTINISKITIKLKKSLRIIFKFHKQQKKILFIGIPKLSENRINLRTQHIALPNFFNIVGLLGNKSVLKSLRLNSKTLQKVERITFSKLLSKPDLIVIFTSNNEESIIKESYKAKIPVIKFNSDFQNNNNKLYSYDIPGNFNFNKKYINNLFFKILKLNK